ncbi:hypothetical protein GCM10019016_017270 [Streptomyces prasinosporus]|uniref:Uncharacterized protein n=1 Tax=Streptomyces prasinosporus TaxID=68256 RepID=A0ABP6TI44_9ACTN
MSARAEAAGPCVLCRREPAGEARAVCRAAAGSVAGRPPGAGPAGTSCFAPDRRNPVGTVHDATGDAFGGRPAPAVAAAT